MSAQFSLYKQYLEDIGTILQTLDIGKDDFDVGLHLKIPPFMYILPSPNVSENYGM